MTKRKHVAWFGVGLAVFVAFAAGVYIGVIVGVDQFQKLDSSAKASVLTGELRALRAGNIDKVIQTKEIEVDGNVVAALMFQQSGMPWLFWPYAHSLDHSWSLKRVAQYRKEYPPVVPKLVPKADTQDGYDSRPFAQDVIRSTEVLIERYGK